MVKMDQRGQISIEFVLVVALMLVIVLLVGAYAGDQNEINTVTAAARTGAMDAATDLALLNRNMEPLRVNDVRINGSGQNLTLLINVSGPISDNSNRTIFNATLQSIADLGYTIDVRNTTNFFDDVVVTGRHTYGVIIV
ncbi:MAG: hypothetical protein PQ968_05075 [Methanobacterium sp.]|jgi:uncharacterized protein (UPF0333 family)